MEAVMKCMEFIKDADRIVNGLENEDQLIMMLGTMTDKWFAKHKVDEENAVRILELLVEMHKKVYKMVGAYENRNRICTLCATCRTVADWNRCIAFQ